MKRIVVLLLFNVMLGFTAAQARTTSVVAAQNQAEAGKANGDDVSTRSDYIKAFRNYAQQGQTAKAVENGVKAAALYYKAFAYQQAFDLVRDIERVIASSQLDEKQKAALYYQTSKERMNMYMQMRRSEKVGEYIGTMEVHARASGDEKLKSDLLYHKAIYYYSFGQTSKGDAVFKEMSEALTKQKEYGKVDDVYKALIASGMKSGSVNLLARAYESYVAWNDSAHALKAADEVNALKRQIADNEAVIAEKDDALATRQTIIAGLSTLAVALAVALVLILLLLLRFLYLTRKQKTTIRIANENIARKAEFMRNLSGQMAPTLQKLDHSIPEVRALKAFTDHIQTLSKLESSEAESVALEEVGMKPFCDNLMNQIRDNVKAGVTLSVDTPQMSAPINQEYVSYILSHLLKNAAKYVADGGTIRLEFKKRGAHTHQFQVSNTGLCIPEEQRESIFVPFREMKDLTQGDGLGLPICRQMAMKMNGELTIDPEFTKGTRFILKLHG